MGTATAQRPPPLWLSLAEAPRVLAEAGSLVPAHRILSRLRRGDGHAVMTIPGLLATDSSTLVLRYYLARWGYASKPWGLGRNLGLRPAHNLEEKLIERLMSLADESGRRVSIVGWSLGGVFAREVARRAPEYVRGVITLGSPLGDPKATTAWRLYEAVSGTRVTDPEIADRIQTLRAPIPGVPVSAIYSTSDSIVSAQISRLPKGRLVENIRVFSSHIGMGLNPLVLAIVADRLRQSGAERWRPYQPGPLARLING